MLSRAQEVTADNLANINTPGFKGNKLFYRMYEEQINGSTVQKTIPMQQINMEQGVLEPTGNALDTGISGQGFFVVEDGTDHLLTRDGRFQMNTDGYLVNANGAKVIGAGGAIHMPEFFQATGDYGGEPKMEIAKDGTIRINDEVVDKIRVVNVHDPANVERRGNGYFFTPQTNITENDEAIGSILQGYYEKGNVDPLHEMVDMMRNMQMFEAQQRAMRTTDETLSAAINSLGRF